MTNILVAIADGTEEIECITAVDVLRRAGAQVTIASTEKTCQITASRGVQLVADCVVSDLPSIKWDLIYLPGGMPGAARLSEHAKLVEIVRKQLEEERWVAAICAAPAVFLGRNGLVKSMAGTCYPSFQNELATQAQTVKHDRVVVDQKLITSQGPGTAMELSLKLVECLYGTSKRNEVAAQLLY